MVWSKLPPSIFDQAFAPTGSGSYLPGAPATFSRRGEEMVMWQMRRNSVVGIIDGPRWDGCTTTGIAFLPRTQTVGFITGSGHAMLMLPRPFTLPRTLTLSEGDALYFRSVKRQRFRGLAM